MAYPSPPLSSRRRRSAPARPPATAGVRFASPVVAKISPVPSLSDQTPEEIGAIWFSNDEIIEIKSEISGIAKAMRRGTVVCGEASGDGSLEGLDGQRRGEGEGGEGGGLVCTRGLEHLRSKEHNEEREREKEASIHAVLNMQALHRLSAAARPSSDAAAAPGAGNGLHTPPWSSRSRAFSSAERADAEISRGYADASRPAVDLAVDLARDDEGFVRRFVLGGEENDKYDEQEKEVRGGKTIRPPRRAKSAPPLGEKSLSAFLEVASKSGSDFEAAVASGVKEEGTRAPPPPPADQAPLVPLTRRGSEPQQPRRRSWSRSMPSLLLSRLSLTEKSNGKATAASFKIRSMLGSKRRSAGRKNKLAYGVRGLDDGSILAL